MQKKSIVFVLTLLCFAATAFAQQPQTDEKTLTGKVQRLNKAPVNPEILKVTLPHVKEATLPNGLPLLVLESHKLPTVSVVLWIESGALTDPADKDGLAWCTADMLREGTAKRSSTQIASELDDLGATFNVGAPFGTNITNVQASGLSISADKLMELVSDIVLNPSFPADELERFRRQEKTRLLQMRSNPAFLARERFSQAVYGSFPAAITSPTADSVQKATPEALKGFHDAYYTPGNAIMAITGDVTMEQATALAKKYFGAW